MTKHQPSPNGHGGPRAHCGGDPALDVAYAERQAKVLAMRTAGATWEQIAAATGYANQKGAYRAWKAAIAAIPRANADEARRVEEERLDALLAACWKAAARGDLWAVDRALRISESRRRLLGLDAPVKHDVALSDAMDREIEQLVAALTDLDAQVGQEPQP